MPEPLQVHLHLDQHPTIGHLRAFLELAAEIPNTAPLGLIRDDTQTLTAITADVVR